MNVHQAVLRTIVNLRTGLDDKQLNVVYSEVYWAENFVLFFW